MRTNSKTWRSGPQTPFTGTPLIGPLEVRGKLDSAIASRPNDFVKLGVENYIRERGMTISEIAAASRSNHKSQGFGTRAYYGERYEYLELLNAHDQQAAVEHFNPLPPEEFFQESLNSSGNEKTKCIAKEIKKTKDLNPDQQQRMKEVWLKSMGLRIFVTAADPYLAKGENEIEVQWIHFGEDDLNLKSISFGSNSILLNQKGSKGQWNTKSVQHYFAFPGLQPHVQVEIEGVQMDLPIVYRTSDPVKGEIVQPVLVVDDLRVELIDPKWGPHQWRSAQHSLEPQPE